MIESFFVVSLIIVESLDMVVESDDMVELESDTVVADSVVSVLVLEQAEASAIIASRKNADLAMFFDELM